MAKSRAEINRAYREKHKEQIAAKRQENKEVYKEKYSGKYDEKRKENMRIKYREDHEAIYYTVKGLPVHKEIWDFANKWLDEARCYRKALNYGEGDLKLILRRNKNIPRRKLTSAEKNICLNALVYLDNEINKGNGDFYTIYNEVLREHANNGRIELINEFLKALTDQKMSFNRGNNGKVFFNVRKENKIVKYKDKETNQESERMVIIRKFRRDCSVSDEMIKVDLQLTPSAFSSWGLLTKDELIRSTDMLDVNPVKVYTNWYYSNDNCYKAVESKYKGFHVKTTENESIVIDAYKNMSVNVKLLQKFIELIPFNKDNVEYGLISQISEAVATLTQRNIQFKHGRMYFNRFTNLKNKFVKDVLLLNEKHIVELFDVKSCFSTLSLILFAQSKHRDEDEVKKMFNIIQQDIYVWIGKEIGFNQKANQSYEEWRDEIKELFNSWLFSTCRGKKRGYKKLIDEKINEHFPAFYKWIHSQQEVMKRNERKSVLSVKCQWLENKLVLNGLFDQVKYMDAITKHDAIYIAKDQYSEELKQDIQDKWNKIIKQELGV